MRDVPEALTIGALARMAGVNIETIRFYQRKKLLRAPERPHGGIRRYGPPDVERLGFIKTAQRLGFSLLEVGELLVLEDGTRCGEARDLAETKLRNVRLRLADLRRMESVLARLVKRCSAARGKVSCPMIAALRRAPSKPRSDSTTQS
jgi:MerR family mercuric resistance operon transcriptional regulator